VIIVKPPKGSVIFVPEAQPAEPTKTCGECAITDDCVPQANRRACYWFKPKPTAGSADMNGHPFCFEPKSTPEKNTCGECDRLGRDCEEDRGRDASTFSCFRPKPAAKPPWKPKEGEECDRHVGESEFRVIVRAVRGSTAWIHYWGNEDDTAPGYLVPLSQLRPPA